TPSSTTRTAPPGSGANAGSPAPPSRRSSGPARTAAARPARPRARARGPAGRSGPAPPHRASAKGRPASWRAPGVAARRAIAYVYGSTPHGRAPYDADRMPTMSSHSSPPFRLRSHLRRTLVLPLTLAFALGCRAAAPAQDTAAPYAATASAAYPAAEWQRIQTPERAGWSGAGLDAVREKLSTMATTGLMAVVDGRVLMEYGDVAAVSYLASVRKSILSMLYGIYVERGAIDLDRTLADLGIDDREGLTERERQATIRHLLAARSGIYHAASNGGDDLASAPPQP